MPFFIIFAAYSLDFIITCLEKRDYKKFLQILSLVVILSLSFQRHEKLQRVRIIDYSNMGTAFSINMNKEDDEKVYENYKKAWDISRSSIPQKRNPELVKSFLRNFYFNEVKKYPGEVRWKKRKDLLRKVSFFDYSFEKAWDQGVQFEGLANLLNNLSLKLALQAIPWEEPISGK